MTAPTLQLQGVTKVYGTPQNPVPVLHGIELEVQEGEFVSIVGPSGSGKSTLLNILGCLDRPTAGHYRLAGTDVATLNDRALSKIRNERIGFVFQSFHLVAHLTVLENVEMPLFYRRIPRARRRLKARELIERVGLGHRTTHLPSELSGGENQRTAIARALANDPAMVLADEPTGNLDTKTGNEIMKLFHELHDSGRTVVMITHDPEVARLAPRRISIRDGVIGSENAPGPEGAVLGADQTSERLA